MEKLVWKAWVSLRVDDTKALSWKVLGQNLVWQPCVVGPKNDQKICVFTIFGLQVLWALSTFSGQMTRLDRGSRSRFFKLILSRVVVVRYGVSSLDHENRVDGLENQDSEHRSKCILKLHSCSSEMLAMCYLAGWRVLKIQKVYVWANYAPTSFFHFC